MLIIFWDFSVSEMRSEDNVKYIKERYRDYYKIYGDNVRSLGWKDEESQGLRFRVLSEIANLSGRSVLDIGCGFGDFYGYLKESLSDFDYRGIDFSEDFINAARKKYPSAEFIVGNFLDAGFLEEYDYVIASGLFNTKITDNLNFLQSCVEKMYRICRCGVAINMLTDKVDYMKEDLCYYNPGSMLNRCLGISRHVALRHDYPLYEFSVYIFK